MILNFIFAESFSLSLIFICLIFSAFFSSAETAITSLGTIKAKHILEQKGRKAATLKIWLKYPGRIITTILLFNNVVNILASSLTTQLAYIYFKSGAVGIATGITTFCVLVFGEIIPKSFAKSHSETFALFSMPIVAFFYYLCFPLVKILSGFANILIKIVSKGSVKTPLITEEEIEFIVSEGEKAGVIKDIKKDIIEGAFDFDETKVREIMTPRTDLAAFHTQTKLNEIIEETIKTGHSRIPVFRDNIDHMVGIVLAKDLLKYLNDQEDESQKDIVAEDVMRDAHFAPESKSIMEVFKDLKRTKSHMAIIIDEYGGTAGIVTMEDILEEIVGEIQDEYDAEEAQILKIKDKMFEVSGAINIDAFFEFFNIEESNLNEEQKGEDVDTLAGWITQMIGQMPKPGQKVQVGNLNLEVLEVSQRRIDLVKVEKNSRETDTKETKLS